MDNKEVLKFNENNLFNSNLMKQFDQEGQRFFLSYLLKKGYKFKIKDNNIEFIDISSDDKIQKVINEYNNETRKSIRKIELDAINRAEIIGIDAYRKQLELEIEKIENGKQNGSQQV